MWISRRIARSEAEEGLQEGKITSSGSAPTIQSVREARAVDTIFPYGYTAHMPKGEKAVMAGEFCIGVSSAESELLEGEIMLRSQGGASIHLKNNGDVIINGQRFVKRD